MSEPCCKNHPATCGAMATMSLIAFIGVGMTFGWRWNFLMMAISTYLDWLIRVWKHKSCAN